MKAKSSKAAKIVNRYRLAGEDDVENIIKLAVKAQARLAKQGIELHWHMSWRPVTADPVK